MALFLNETGFIGTIIRDFTNNITGSLLISLLIIMIFLMVIALIFRIPIEYTSILLLPLFLVFMAATSDFLAVGGVILIYLGIILAKNYFLS